MAMSVSDSHPVERLHALDAVRGLALLLGIVLHATLSFIPAPIHFWMVEDRRPSFFLAILFFIIHIFRMTTFFLIAGFFAHLSFHRRGTRAFIRDRLRRIALPLLIGWLIMFAIVVAVGWIFSGYALFHLWFLYVLLELYAAVLILRAVMVLIDRDGKIRGSADRLFIAVVRSPFGPAVASIPVAILLAADRQWLRATDLSPLLTGIPTPGAFLTSLRGLLAYGVAFGVGWFLHRNIELLQELARRWALNLCLAFALTTAILCIITTSLTGGDTTSRSTLIISIAAGVTCYALAAWAATFALIGIAIRFFSGFSSVRRYIADSSYWLYLIHLPIVVGLQIAVSRLDWPWPVKFVAILAAAFSLLFASYQLFVRHTFIGAALNGVRRSPQARDARAKSFPWSRSVPSGSS
jgi:hypothetical protein